MVSCRRPIIDTFSRIRETAQYHWCAIGEVEVEVEVIDGDSQNYASLNKIA